MTSYSPLVPEEILEKNVKSLDLIVKSYPMLKGMDITTVKDLLEADPRRFKYSVFEPFELEQIEKELEKLTPGLYIGMMYEAKKMAFLLTL